MEKRMIICKALTSSNLVFLFLAFLAFLGLGVRTFSILIGSKSFTRQLCTTKQNNIYLQ